MAINNVVQDAKTNVLRQNYLANLSCSKGLVKLTIYMALVYIYSSIMFLLNCHVHYRNAEYFQHSLGQYTMQDFDVYTFAGRSLSIHRLKDISY